jgi:hypothetical protein
VISPLIGQIEGYIEWALRDFKAALERKGQEARATGTFGGVSTPPNVGQENPTYGSPTLPVEFTRPPEARS